MLLPNFRTHGFSLLELLLTITIAALILGLVLPSFSKLAARARQGVAFRNAFVTTSAVQTETLETSATTRLKHFTMALLVRRDCKDLSVSSLSARQKQVPLRSRRRM